jgi:hypothetical protein
MIPFNDAAPGVCSLISPRVWDYTLVTWSIGALGKNRTHYSITPF